MQKICLIIPCYNEALRLPREAILQYLRQHPKCHVLLVNDGSRDNTQAVLEQLVSASGQATLLNLNQNGGKAAAVRAGMLHAQTVHSDCEYFGFWDADLSTPLEELNWYHDFSGGELSHKLIIGSRISRLGAKVQRKMIRHYLGRIFSTLASNLLHLAVYDTQCGAKLLHRSLLDAAFAKPFVTRWLFDVEIFARLIEAFGAAETAAFTLEVPLRTWNDIKGSKIRMTDFLKIPLELLRIRRNYKVN